MAKIMSIMVVTIKKISLYNTIGSLQLEQTLPLDNSNMTLDVSHIPTGLYIVVLSQGNQKKSVKKILGENVLRVMRANF